MIDSAILELPVRQREVITARDIVGMEADEAAAILNLTTGNQRVLLHRARSRVRAALERYGADSIGAVQREHGRPNRAARGGPSS